MCTALTYLSGDFYMGRTLDYERGYGEEVVVTPRAYPFAFRHEGLCAQHYSIIGTACVADGYPLYYDAMYAILGELRRQRGVCKALCGQAQRGAV